MLTDDEIKAALAPLFAKKDALALKFAMDTSIDEYHAIIAAYQAKLRHGVELPEAKHFYHDKDDHRTVRKPLDLFTKDQLQQYGDAHDQAGYLRGLDDAKRVCESFKQGKIAMYIDDDWADMCAAAIEKLKRCE